MRSIGESRSALFGQAHCYHDKRPSTDTVATRLLLRTTVFLVKDNFHMFEKLITAGELRADEAVARTIIQLAITPVPPGVTVEPVDGGIALTGKGLRRRMLNDPKLRNFGL